MTVAKGTTLEARSHLVSPDGGWGWMVVLGASLVNLSTRSIEPSFGLLFGDLLKELGVATTGASVIMSTLDAMINFSGLFVGPLIKRYGYRTVGVVGGILSSLALTSTSTADSLLCILFTYSIMAGIGFGLLTASTFVALNSYFEQKRGQAVGLAMAGTALGFMAMPQLVSFLLTHYDFRGALVILGAVSLNSIVGATLLQPVEWHLREPPSDPEQPLIEQEMKEIKRTATSVLAIPEIQEPEATDLLLPESVPTLERKNSTPSLVGFRKGGGNDQLSALLPDAGIRRQLSVASALYLHNNAAKPQASAANSPFFKPNQLNRNNRLITSIPLIGSAASITSRHRKTSAISNVSHLDFMGSTMHIELDDCCEEDGDFGMEMKLPATISGNNCQQQDHSVLSKVDGKKMSPTIGDTFIKFWARLNKVMDFDLLKDTIYLNILFGLSITYVAELNFKTVVPFFMESMGYTKQDVALALSLMAIADIIARVTVPPILDRLPYSRRATLMFGCFLLAIVRSLLAEQTEWTPLLACFITNGFLRGITLINVPLVLSEYASNDKYPAALGLSMVAKGIFIVMLGPLIGIIRDISDSYPLSIHTQAVMIASCLIAWGIEYMLVWNRQRKKSLSTT